MNTEQLERGWIKKKKFKIEKGEPKKWSELYIQCSYTTFCFSALSVMIRMVHSICQNNSVKTNNINKKNNNITLLSKLYENFLECLSLKKCKALTHYNKQCNSSTQEETRWSSHKCFKVSPVKWNLTEHAYCLFSCQNNSMLNFFPLPSDCHLTSRTRSSKWV